jgi:hypothetical protein
MRFAAVSDMKESEKTTSYWKGVSPAQTESYCTYLGEGENVIVYTEDSLTCQSYWN